MQRTKTPSQITVDLIQAAMSIGGLSAKALACKAKVHPNTVYMDLRDPDRIPQNRLWLYFTVLDIPVQDALNRIAESFAHSITRR